MFSIDQLVLILVALVVVGLALGALLVIVIVRRRATSARLPSRQPRAVANADAGTDVGEAPVAAVAADPADLADPDIRVDTADQADPADPDIRVDAEVAIDRLGPPEGATDEPSGGRVASTEGFTPEAVVSEQPSSAAGFAAVSRTEPVGSAPAILPTEREGEPRPAADDLRASDSPAGEAELMDLDLDPTVNRATSRTADLYIDPVTGLDSLLAWERTLVEENARLLRYRRPVSVVVAELDGLGRLVDRFGADPARRVLPAVGDAMRRYARRSDRVAHAGGGRFLVLLPETDEIQTINYVERVRAACERWLEAGAVALRLSIGWASPTAVGELETALHAAEERMYAERRRAHQRSGSASADPI